MKSKFMIGAYEHFAMFQQELRRAHNDAINADDKFAEILIFNLLEQTGKTHNLLKRMSEASE